MVQVEICYRLFVHHCRDIIELVLVVLHTCLMVSHLYAGYELFIYYLFAILLKQMNY